MLSLIYCFHHITSSPLLFFIGAADSLDAQLHNTDSLDAQLHNAHSLAAERKLLPFEGGCELSTGIAALCRLHLNTHDWGIDTPLVS